MSDPYGDAEASRYDNPVASRKWLLSCSKRPTLDYEEMASLTQTIESNRKGLFARLSAMCRDGQIITIGLDVMCWWIAGLVSGRVIAHRDGFGFFEPMTTGIRSICMIGRSKGIMAMCSGCGDATIETFKSKREARIVEC